MKAHESTFYVYVLSDSASPDNVRYIGWSVNPKVRLRRHQADAQKNISDAHKDNWVRTVLAAGRTLLMRVVAEAPTRTEAGKIEIEQIAYYRSQGFDLTNSTTGGDGVVGWSPELRDRMRRLKIGKKLGPHSAETRRKISESQKGRRLSPKKRAQAIAALEQWRVALRTDPEQQEVIRRKHAEAGLKRRGKRPPEVAARCVAITRSPEVRAKLSEAARRQWREGRGWKYRQTSPI